MINNVIYEKYYQQLKQFDKAEKELFDRYAKYKQANLLVQLGFNYQLQKDQVKATNYYVEALEVIRKNPNEVYAIAYLFEKKGIIKIFLQILKEHILRFILIYITSIYSL